MGKYFLVLSILIIISFIYLKLALKYKIIDKPNQRSSHTKITVRGGGILFTISIILFFILNDYQYLYFVLGVILISIISFLDDIYTISSKIRFPFQLIAVLLVLYQIGLPLDVLSLLYLFLGIGIINMFNFMDGINGITGVYSLSVLSGYYLINAQEALINPYLIIYVVISIIVFGFYNFRRKAVFFAGDIGSVTIGMLIFFIGFSLAVKLSSPLLLLIMVVYGADAGCTLLYRKFFTKESVFDPHRHHIYQKLVDLRKISHIKVSIIYASIQVFVNIIIFNTYTLDLQTQFLVFLVLVLSFIGYYIYLFKKLKV
jgi:UDP-GlcNAc:undecaprenyl-phosphate GlcNAc-1-phosphate transferase